MVDPSLLDENGKFKFVPFEIAEKIKREFRFITHLKSHIIYVYADGVYEPRGEETIRERARELLGDEANEHRVNEVVSHIRETTYTNPEKFYPPPHLINVKNGILNVLTKELVPHDPNHVFLNELPVEYSPGAACPKILKFLREVVNEEDVPVLQEWVGYCLYRSYCFARALMLIGSGGNGKSTFLNLVSRLLGEDNVAAPSLQDLMYNRFTRAELFGKLANIHADIPAMELRRTGVFKMLTGQDKIFADVKMRKPFDFRNYAKLMYSANELPRTNDTSEAFWRRWILIRFPNTFPERGDETREKLLEELSAPDELSGFLNWALAGLNRLLDQRGFTMSRTRADVEKEWISQSDPLRAFVMEYVEEKTAAWVSKDDFYEAYQQFCSERGAVAEEKNIVGRRLPVLAKTAEFKPKHPGTDRQVRAWKNIALKKPFDKITYNITDITDITDFFTAGEKKERTDITHITKNSTTNYRINPALLSVSSSGSNNSRNSNRNLRDTRPMTDITHITHFSTDLTPVEVLVEFPHRLAWAEGEAYGPFARGAVVFLPTQLALSLERKGVAKMLEGGGKPAAPFESPRSGAK